MLAEYIGKDGAMGFKTGQVYNIIFEPNDNVFFVRTSEGKIGIYSNEKSALKNWKIKGGDK